MTTLIADAVEQIGQTGWWWPYQVAFYAFITFVAVCAWIATRKHPHIRLLTAATTIAASGALGGDALEQIGRYDTTKGARDAVSGANYSVYSYIQANPMQALGYVYAFGDNSSTSRATAGAMISAGTMAGNPGDLGFSSGTGIGPLGYTTSGGYHWGTPTLGQ